MPADRLRSRNDHRTRSEAHAGAGSRGHRARRCGSPRRADRHVHRPARHRSAGRSLHAHGRGLREGRRRQRPARAAHRGRIGGCALRPPRRHRQNTRRTAMTDKTREALKRARECITADRKSLYDSHINPATRRLDAYGQAGVDEYDDVLTLIDAALAAQPAQALAIPLLVAAGHVSQAKADEAFSIACNAFEEEAQRMDVELPWVTRAAQPPAVEAEPVPDPNAGTDADTLRAALRDNLPLNVDQRSALYEMLAAPLHQPQEGWVSVPKPLTFDQLQRGMRESCIDNADETAADCFEEGARFAERAHGIAAAPSQGKGE